MLKYDRVNGSEYEDGTGRVKIFVPFWRSEISWDGHKHVPAYTTDGTTTRTEMINLTNGDRALLTPHYPPILFTRLTKMLWYV